MITKQMREKALGLIRDGKVKRVGSMTFLVGSGSNDAIHYWVDWAGTEFAYCSCPATSKCSHRLAAAIVLRLEKLHQELLDYATDPQSLAEVEKDIELVSGGSCGK